MSGLAKHVIVELTHPNGQIFDVTHEDLLGVWVGGSPVLLAPGMDTALSVNCQGMIDVDPGLCAPLAPLDIDLATIFKHTRDSVPLADTSLQAPCVP